MSSSQRQNGAREPFPSPAISLEKFTASQQNSLTFEDVRQLAGSYDDAETIREILTRSIKRCGRTRMAIAEEMSYLLGRAVTEKMLNAFTADRDDRRWPAEFDRAFCAVTGDYELLRQRVEHGGFRLVGPEEMEMLELGRAFLQRTEAEEQMALLQRRLHGRVR